MIWSTRPAYRRPVIPCVCISRLRSSSGSAYQFWPGRAPLRHRVEADVRHPVRHRRIQTPLDVRAFALRRDTRRASSARICVVADGAAALDGGSRASSARQMIEPRLCDAQKRVNESERRHDRLSLERTLRLSDVIQRWPKMNHHQIGLGADQLDVGAPSVVGRRAPESFRVACDVIPFAARGDVRRRVRSAMRSIEKIWCNAYQPSSVSGAVAAVKLVTPFISKS